MAGWKLRKDKTLTETSDAAPLTEDPAPTTEFATSPVSTEKDTPPFLQNDPVFHPYPAAAWEIPTEAAVITPVEDDPVTFEDLLPDEREHIPAAPIDLDDLSDSSSIPLSFSEIHATDDTASPFLEEEDPATGADLHFDDEESLPVTNASASPITIVPEASVPVAEAAFQNEPDALEAIAAVPSLPAALAVPQTLPPEIEAQPEPAEDHPEEPAPIAGPLSRQETVQEKLDEKPPDVAAEAPVPADPFPKTLRIARSELAGAFALPGTAPGIPSVSPFLVEVPPLAPPPTKKTHRLVVRLGRLSAPFDITKDVTVIGRPDSELHIYPDIEIDLDDAVSRRHAELHKLDDGYYLMDVGSTNGTMLNGEALPPQEKRLLANGDRIRVGDRTEIIFE